VKVTANIRVILIAGALLLPWAAAAANPNHVVEIFKEVSNNLKSGNTDKLSPRFASFVDLWILATEQACSAQQAAAAVDEFFLQHKPTKFTMLHLGGKGNKHYGIGLLTTVNGKFRVTVFLLVNESNSYEIQQLRIDNEH
jgi:hypothetical protein